MNARRLLPFALLTVLSACGPGESPPPSTPKTISSASTKPISASTPEDRSPVEAPPPGLFAQLHASSPKGAIDPVRGYLPSLAKFLDADRLLAELDEAGSFGSVVDLSKPADVHLVMRTKADGSLRPDFQYLWAFGFDETIDVEKTLGKNFRIDPQAGGVRLLVPKKHGMGFRYAIAPSLGPTKYRLLGANGPHADRLLLTYGPWITRGVTTRADDGSTLRFDFEVSRLRTAFAKELSKFRDEARAELASGSSYSDAKHPQLSKVGKKLLATAADGMFDFVDDLDAVTITATLAPKGVTLTSKMAFGAHSSWMARALLSAADAPAGPPPAFAKMPAEGWVAAYGRAATSADALMIPVQSALLELVEATAVDFSWGKKDKDAGLELVRLMFPKSADHALVSTTVPKPGTKKVKGDPLDVAPFESAMRFLSDTSWTIAAVDREVKSSIDLSKALAAFVTRPVISEMVKTLSEGAVRTKIVVKEQPAKDFAKGSFAQNWDVTIEKKKEGSKTAFDLLGRLQAEELIVPEGTGRTWSAWGQNVGKGVLATKLKDAMTAKSTDTLGGMLDIEFLTKSGAPTGMRFGIEGMLRSAGPSMGVQPEDVLSELPDKGKSGIFYRASATKSSAEDSVFVPRDLIRAIAVLAERSPSAMPPPPPPYP